MRDRRRPLGCLAAHGFADQEAPQAHAQEEAQEDAEAHTLATPRRQVATRAHAVALVHGAGRTTEPSLAREARPRRTTSPAAGQPRRAARSRRPAGRATPPGGARRRVPPARGRSAVRPSARPGRPTPGRPRAWSTPNGGVSSVKCGPRTAAARPSRRRRYPRPAAHEAERTSAPSDAATARSSLPAHRSTAAASAEPPPTHAGGDPLGEPHRGRAARPRAAPAAPGCGRRSGPAGRRPDHLEAVALGRTSARRPGRRHHLGVDQVEAVGPPPAIRSDSVSLAGARHHLRHRRRPLRR